MDLETTRLKLREYQAGDWTAVHTYGTDEEVYRHQPWGPNSEEDSRGFIAMTLAQQSDRARAEFELAVIEKSSGLLIGGVGIRVKSRSNRDADIGYTLNRGRWGHGFATEAAIAILDFGFNHLKLHRIWATASPHNAASIRVLEKLGMKQEGHLRENLLVRGKWRDSVLYSLLESDPRP